MKSKHDVTLKDAFPDSAGPWRVLFCLLVLSVGFPGVHFAGDDDGDESVDPAEMAFQEQVAKFESEKELEDYERLQTILDFGDLGSSKVLPFLTKAFGEEENPAIWAAVVRAAGKIGSEDAVHFIVTDALPMLAEDPLNFSAVPESLRGPFDPKLEKWLLTHLLTEEVRKYEILFPKILTVVAEFKDRKRFTRLAKVLKTTSDSRVQTAILETFRDYRPKSARKVAKKFLKSRKRKVQLAALEVYHALKVKARPSTYTKLLKSKHAEVKLLAIDMLAMSGSSKFVKLVAPLVLSKDKRVSIASVHALASTASKKGMEVLVGAIDQSVGRVRDDILDALIRLTGEDAGTTGAQWESWWAVNKDRAKLVWRDPEEYDLVRKKIESEQRAGVTKLDDQYFGLRVISDKVVFVVDSSTSMEEVYVTDPEESEKKDDQKNGESSDGEGGDSGGDAKEPEAKKKKKKRFVGPSKMMVARKELLNVISTLRDGISLNVIRFETFVTPWRPEMEELSKELRGEIETFVKSSSPNGMTNVFGAIESAFQDENVDTIYFLSDGAPTHGRYTETKDILRAVANLNRYRRVRINTIGFGLDGDARRLMVRLAGENYGRYVPK